MQFIISDIETPLLSVFSLIGHIQLNLWHMYYAASLQWHKKGLHPIYPQRLEHILTAVQSYYHTNLLHEVKT